MRILYLINTPGAQLFGAGRQMLAIARHMRDRGATVVIVAPPDSAVVHEATRQGFTTEAATFSATPWSVLRLRRITRSHRPDVVHAMSFMPLALAGLARRSRTLPARFASVLVDPVSPHALSTKMTKSLAVRLRILVARAAADSADAVFCVSDSVADRLRRLGVSGDLRVVHDTVDVAELTRRAAAPLVPALPTDRPRIGTAAARLVAGKGPDVLLAAFAQVVGRVPTAHLVIAGALDPSLDLRAQADALGIADRITFTGYLEDTAPLFAALDVFVLPSLSEGLNSSVIEAGALGVPVVASRVGGVPEAVEDGYTGLLVPPGDADELSRALVALLDDEGTTERMGARARERAGELFSAENTVALIAQAYEQALTRRSEDRETT